jgi:uncharacterized protein (TIGR03067 family)
MRSRILLLVVSVVVLGFAPAPLPRKERHRQDLTDVDGTWQFVLWEFEGLRLEDCERTVRVEATKERFTLARQREAHTHFQMRLDPLTSPPSFTLSLEGEVWCVGSYRLRKDELTMIFQEGKRPQERPTDFAGKARYRFVLRRVSR